MNVFTGAHEIPPGLGPSAVTIGKFDGVHTGHRAVLAQVNRVATERALRSVVVTFDRNPLALLRPERCPRPLVSTTQKCELLAEAGIDTVVVLPFDEPLSRLDAPTFVERILVGQLQVAALLAGRDFRFGAGGRGDVDLLISLGEKHNFDVILVDDVADARGDRASSTKIRRLLEQGEVEQAAALLGRYPSVRGEIVHGLARGRQLGFPTANVSSAMEGFPPDDGVYAGWLRDRGRRYPAAISVGDNPTFDGVAKKQVEAYVLDEDMDLYGHVVDVEFVQRLRGMVAFAGIEPLIEQMRADIEQTRQIITGSRAATRSRSEPRGRSIL